MDECCKEIKNMSDLEIINKLQLRKALLDDSGFNNLDEFDAAIQIIEGKRKLIIERDVAIALHKDCSTELNQRMNEVKDLKIQVSELNRIIAEMIDKHEAESIGKNIIIKNLKTELLHVNKLPDKIYSVEQVTCENCLFKEYLDTYECPNCPSIIIERDLSMSDNYTTLAEAESALNDYINDDDTVIGCFPIKPDSCNCCPKCSTYLKDDYGFERNRCPECSQAIDWKGNNDDE